MRPGEARQADEEHDEDRHALPATSHAELSFSAVTSVAAAIAAAIATTGHRRPGSAVSASSPTSCRCRFEHHANADGFSDEAWRPTRLSSCAYLREVRAETILRVGEFARGIAPELRTRIARRIARRNCAAYTAEVDLRVDHHAAVPEDGGVTTSVPRRRRRPTSTARRDSTECDLCECSSECDHRRNHPCNRRGRGELGRIEQAAQLYSEFCATADEQSVTKTVSSVSGISTAIAASRHDEHAPSPPP